MAMAEAECPVCLQSYDGEQTIPRVLNCGHSACDSCLSILPQKHALTIRCPECNLLVKFPPLGPTSLPKNIELLRLLHPNKSKPTSLAHWNSSILPHHSLLHLHSSHHAASLSFASLNDQNVSLFKVAPLLSTKQYGYAGSIVKCLADMPQQHRHQLATLTKFSTVLGFWADTDHHSLYLVCQRLTLSLQNFICLRDGDGFNTNGLSLFATMGMEICEQLITLHKQGFIAGCLGFTSFNLDDFGHLYLDLNDVLVSGRKIVVQVSCGGRGIRNEQVGVLLSDLLKSNVFFSPEVLFELLNKIGIAEFRYSVDYGSDVWPLACVLIGLLVGKPFTQELIDYVHCVGTELTEENSLDCLVGVYMDWVDKVCSLLQTKLGTEFVFLQQMFCQCLNFNPMSRPLLIDVWKCIRTLIIEPEFDHHMIKLDHVAIMQNKGHCLVLGEMCWLPKQNAQTQEKDGLSIAENSTEADINQVEAANGVHLVEGIAEKNFKFKDMKGHLDCVTGLAVGGGFLFSSSFDKSVHVWSLQDFSHIHTFKGHEHKVMAVVYVDEEAPLCISGDNGGSIYVWSIIFPLGQEPLKKWNEQKDWRYSGIHALIVYGQYLYTGSGDKTIKVWSLQDGTLLFTMNGHKSVVSTLAVCDGVLYSGSWDGTIRLWSLSDNSPLAVLEDDSAGTMSSVLSLAADQHTLVASHENGSIKVWRDDVFMKSAQIHDGSIFTICLEEKWLFSGGWDQNINLQELIEDEFQVDPVPIGSIPSGSVITALLYWQGKLFVGCADRTVKVYYYEK